MYVDTTIEGVIELLKGSGQDKLMQAYYNAFKDNRWLNSAVEGMAFMDEMRVIKHTYDENFVVFAAAASRAKKPIRREITRAVRCESKDGKEYIRFSANFYSENKYGEPINASAAYIGVWEEPHFKKQYNKKTEEWEMSFDISHTTPHYDYEWNPQTVKELSKEFTRTTQFFIINNQGPRKYMVTREEWCNSPREEIIRREMAAVVKVNRG